MILNVVSAEYIQAYKIILTFDSKESIQVDLKQTIFKDSRKIFMPLRNMEYFKKFSINLNTIAWENEADFAPEFLLQLGKSQSKKN
jgi:hypothetical protein